MSTSSTTQIKNFLRWLGVDQALSYAVWGKLWQIFAGPITILMISRYMNPEAQGYYYAFMSIVAIGALIEFGFYTIIIQFASHEWSELHLDSNGNITGNPKAISRLVSLGRLVFKWHLFVAVFFVFAVGIGGFLFLGRETSTNLNWQNPWTIYIILSGLELLVIPMLTLLEGCNQVANINLIRLIQSISKSLVIWFVLLFGGQLWIAAGVTAINLLIGIVIPLCLYRNFFKPFVSLVTDWNISWKKEIWPLQWRVSISSFGGYFIQPIFTPIIFHYHGAVMAGKMGMTLQLIAMLESLAVVWVTVKVPRFGMLVVQKKWSELDRLYFRTMISSISILLVVSLLLLGGVYGLHVINNPIIDRIVSPTIFGIFLGAAFFAQIANCHAFYLRAHKKEPLLTLSIVFSLTNGFLVWFLGSQFANMGISVAYLLTCGLLFCPFSTVIFFRFRKKLHA